MNGKRPWLVEWSPTRIPNWHYDTQGLAWAVVLTARRRPTVDENGKMAGSKGENGFMLLVREGVGDLGPDYVGGGWWEFTAKGERIPDAEGVWGGTRGEIPMVPLFYERDQGEDQYENPLLDPAAAGAILPTERQAALDPRNVTGLPGMSRPGITELGQVAIGYLDVASAGDFEVWDAGSGLRWPALRESGIIQPRHGQEGGGQPEHPRPTDQCRGGLSGGDPADL